MYDYIISLPLSPDVLRLGFGILCLVFLSGVIWLSLRRFARLWKKKPSALLTILLVSAPLYVPLILGAVGAAIAVLWHTVATVLSKSPAGPSLGAGTLIAALLGAPFLIWGTVLRQKAVDVQKEGHITDRINAAVEMLGAEKTVKRHLVNSYGEKVFKKGDDGKPDMLQPTYVEQTVPNIEVRIGGLLSLERIAQDSTRNDGGRDHVRVMEILCTYIRENAKAGTAKDFPLPEWEPLPEDATAEERAQHEMWREARFRDRYNANAWEWAQSLPKPREDIQLALTIIGRRAPAQLKIEAQWGPKAKPKAKWVFEKACLELPDRGDAPLGQQIIKTFKSDLKEWRNTLRTYPGYRPDLRGTNLQGADMTGVTLSGAQLQNARMEGADLRGARMDGADLTGARIKGAYLTGARMAGADLEDARMEGAILWDVRMQGAHLAKARMEGAILGDARMEGADLANARMEGADLLAARMEGANLRDALMEGADLTGAQMEGADLTGALK